MSFRRNATSNGASDKKQIGGSFKGTSSTSSYRHDSTSSTGSASNFEHGPSSSHKLVMIGDSGVGKSCILEKLVDDTSTNTFISTIGVDIRHHSLKTDDGRTVKLQVWDTGGQQRYRPVLSTCYRNAAGVIIVFDVTNHKSFTNLNQWMTEIDEFTSTLGRKEATPKLLIGNKSDLEERREVDSETASKFAKDRNMLYVETSAIKTTPAIAEAFLSIVRPRLASTSSTSSQRDA